jgi:hypothetical protein
MRAVSFPAERGLCPQKLKAAAPERSFRRVPLRIVHVLHALPQAVQRSSQFRIHAAAGEAYEEEAPVPRDGCGQVESDRMHAKLLS